jgi:tripartite-type tricarboxylate transporter receptor subunit TctC
MKIMTVFAIATVASCAQMATQAHAQSAPTFPNKLVTLVVPFTASSGSDIIARIISPKLSARWGHPVIVDNKPGASGNIGAQQVAKAPPDGHTLLMAINTFTMTPAIYKTLPYDAVGEFEPVAKLAEASFVFAVNPNVPAKDMKSLVAYIKANPGRANYASPGNGTPQHLAMELLKANQHLDIVHVPYRGIAGALTDLTGGQVQMMFATIPSMRPLAQSGRVRLLAVTGLARNPLAPDVPTFREQGIDVMDSVDAWYAVLAPARTPPDIVARINRDFIAVMNDADVKAQLAEMGLAVQTGSPAQLGALIKSDLARWKTVVNAAGITAD